MDEATLNKLYGWKGRVHKAIKVFEQCKMEYGRVCALPKTTGALLKSIKQTTCDYDADIALTWVLLESSRKIVDVTCDGYIASIRRSFHDYRTKQEERALASPPNARRNIHGTNVAAAPTIETNNNNDDEDDDEDDDDATTPPITIWIESIVENTINSHVKFIEQWRYIISDAQKEVTVWKSEHEKYLDKMCEVEEARNKLEDPNYVDSDSDSDSDSDDVDSDDSDDSDDEYDSENDSDDDSDSDSVNEDRNEEKNDDEDDDNDNSENDTNDSVNGHGNDPLQLLRMGMRLDEHADRLFQMGTYVSAGKVLISSLKIASKIESIEAAAQEAGTACILGLTQRNLRDRDVALSNTLNNAPTMTGINHDDGNTAGSNPSESSIFEEWKEQADTTKLDAIYSWYRMYHGALSSVNTKHL